MHPLRVIFWGGEGAPRRTVEMGADNGTVAHSHGTRWSQFRGVVQVVELWRVKYGWERPAFLVYSSGGTCDCGCNQTPHVEIDFEEDRLIPGRKRSFMDKLAIKRTKRLKITRNLKVMHICCAVVLSDF